jgi:hypothetical protein
MEEGVEAVIATSNPRHFSLSFPRLNGAASIDESHPHLDFLLPPSPARPESI